MDYPRSAAWRRFLAALLCAALLCAGAPAGAWARAEQPALGPLGHYNALLFDHFESVHGFMEGALAVRGEARFGTTSGSYDAGLAAERPAVGLYENPKGYPTLLLGGLPAVGMDGYSNCHVWGGPVALRADHLDAYQAGAQQFNIHDPAGLLAADSERVERFFDEAYDTVVHAGLALERAHSGGRLADATLRLWDFVGWNTLPGVFDELARFEPDNLDADGARVLVVRVEDEEHVEINAPRLTEAFADYDLVVLHFPNASSARFTGSAVHIGATQLNPYAAAGTADNALLGEYARRLVWHFPQATAVQIVGHGIVGSLVAPRAYVEGSGGVIDGMLVARSLLENGGMSLNAFPLDERFFGLANPDGEAVLTGSVRLVKRDGESGALLAGAAFELYRQNELGIWQRYGEESYTTLVDGGLSVDGLPEGDYFFLETRAPDGYFLHGERIPFPIDAAHGVESPVLLRVDDQLVRVPLSVRKVDGDSGDALEGARFLLFETTGGQVEIVAEPVSDRQGLLEVPPLAYGSYRLVEIAPPDGYESRFRDYLDLEVSGDAEGNAGISYRTSTGLVSLNPYEEIELPNLRSETARKRLVVNKLDREDEDTPLDDAVFSLERQTDGGWTVIHPELRTDAYGLFEVEDLEDGVYRLSELAPSAGYRAIEEVYVFSLDPASDTTVVEVYNQAVGRITVEKVDSADPDKKLAGAEFVLYYDAGGDYRSAVGRIEEVGSGETGEDGLLRFEGLKPGRYYVVQTRAPAGYRPIETPELAGSTIVSYILDVNGEKVLYPEEVAIEVLAEPDLATATLHKVDAAVYRSAGYTPDHGLAGARFVMRRYDEEAHAWEDYRDGLVTGSDGRTVIDELPVGVYKLVEISPPPGYAMDAANDRNEVIFSVRPGDGVLNEEIVVENYRTASERAKIRGERLPFDLVLEPENPHTGAENRNRLLPALLLLLAAWLLRPRRGRK